VSDSPCNKEQHGSEPVQQQKRPPWLSEKRLELLGSDFCNPTDTSAKASTNQARSPSPLMPSASLRLCSAEQTNKGVGFTPAQSV